MATMKEVCDQVGVSYETLRFYCNEDLVPNIKRDRNNYRVFDEKNINWIKSLQCLKKCGMSINDMKLYMNLCLQGPSTIQERKQLLDIQKGLLLRKMSEIHDSIEFIDEKQKFFDSVLAGETVYISNLIRTDE